MKVRVLSLQPLIICRFQEVLIGRDKGERREVITQKHPIETQGASQVNSVVAA